MKPLQVRLASAASLSIALLLAALPPRAASAEPQTLTIAAANSLKEALREIIPLFERQQGDVEVRVVWGPSQTLRDQIAEGAPIDVFLPSSAEEIDELERRGLTLAGTKQEYAKTALVLITSAAVPAAVNALADLSAPQVRRIAVGDPRTSSVGKFTAEAMKRTGANERLRSRYLYAQHSGAVLELVAAGEAEAGIVYRTDAIHNKKVRIVAEIDPAAHSPIVYGLATVWTSTQPLLSRQFRQFILTPAIQSRLQAHGFEPAPGAVASR